MERICILIIELTCTGQYKALKISNEVKLGCQIKSFFSIYLHYFVTKIYLQLVYCLLLYFCRS